MIVDDKELCYGLIDAIFTQAIADYAMALRAEAKGKKIVSYALPLPPATLKADIEDFLLDWLGKPEVVARILKKINNDAPKERRGSKWPRQKERCDRKVGNKTKVRRRKT